MVRAHKTALRPLSDRSQTALRVPSFGRVRGARASRRCPGPSQSPPSLETCIAREISVLFPSNFHDFKARAPPSRARGGVALPACF
eukprot:365766-Chlamydomonas_euryale.AAC.7